MQVKWSTYKEYFRLAGGWKLIIPLNIFFAAYIGCTIMANFVMQQWAYGS